MHATAPPLFVAQPAAAPASKWGNTRPDAFATSKASTVGRSARRGDNTYTVDPTAYTGRPRASWLTIDYRRASNNSRSTNILCTATQASSTMPSPNILRRATQPTTTTLPMAPYTANNTPQGDLACPYTARTNYTDVDRPWVLFDVPGYNQEDAGIIRRVKTPTHTKKEKEAQAEAGAQHTEGGRQRKHAGPTTPCSPCVRSGEAPSPDQAGSPAGSELGGAKGRRRADSAAATCGGTPAGR